MFEEGSDLPLKVFGAAFKRDFYFRGYGIDEDVSEPMSMTAIGQNLNMSRDRVRKLLEKGLCALRQESDKIQDYL